MSTIKAILGTGLKTGAMLAVTTTAAIMLASDREQGNPWAAINAITHVVDGEEVTQPVTWSPHSSLLGVVINGSAMAAWGILYAGVLTMTRTKSNLLTGAIGAAVSYAVDYHAVPKRFTPGIEHRLSPRSVLFAYATLGATLALSGKWSRENAEEM